MRQEQNKDMSQYFYRASAADFMKIPGSPITYWVSTNFLNIFENNPKLGDKTKARQGLATGDNSIFARLWHEISFLDFETSARSCSDTNASEKKWFPYNKGGEFRRWYGNIQWVVDWQNDGLRIRNFRDGGGKLRSRPQNTDCYFQEGITWSDVTSGYLSMRYLPPGCIYDISGHSAFPKTGVESLSVLAYLNTVFAKQTAKMLNPTMHFQIGDYQSFPYPIDFISEKVSARSEICIKLSKEDWESYETSWDFDAPPLLQNAYGSNLQQSYEKLHTKWQQNILDMQSLEEENNRLFIEAYRLQDELLPDVPLEEITLTCNPHYRYGGNRSEEELETLLQCDTIRELVSYAIGCMMGRYSLDKPGLILASQGETLQDYLQQIPSPSFAPDDDAILPLTDQEWFSDDATNRFREFVRVVWGDDNLHQNLDFVAESLCLHAIKAKRGESALDTIRRYLSTQFFKDHMRTYKKRPIYWLFSSGKHKAFECLVYLHRYNEGTLARMRTEYVIPLSAKLNSYAEKLEQAKESASSTAETKRLEKELTTLHNQQAELAEFDEKLRHYADQRISLDLDDGVKVNYGKFGDLLAEVKSITGEAPEVTL